MDNMYTPPSLMVLSTWKDRDSDWKARFATDVFRWKRDGPNGSSYNPVKDIQLVDGVKWWLGDNNSLMLIQQAHLRVEGLGIRYSLLFVRFPWLRVIQSGRESNYSKGKLRGYQLYRA